MLCCLSSSSNFNSKRALWDRNFHKPTFSESCFSFCIKALAWSSNAFFSLFTVYTSRFLSTKWHFLHFSCRGQSTRDAYVERTTLTQVMRKAQHSSLHLKYSRMTHYRLFQSKTLLKSQIISHLFLPDKINWTDVFCIRRCFSWGQKVPINFTWITAIVSELFSIWTPIVFIKF